MACDPVIEVTGLGRFPKYVLLDVRDPSAFADEHARNAVRVPVEIWEASAKSSGASFDNIPYWEDAISQLGIDGLVPAIIYDDGRLTEAARVWFILQYFGAKAFILNGGWPAIRGLEGLPPAQLREAGAETVTFRARAGAGSVGLVDRQILKSQLGGDVRIFDARTKDEFAGDDLRRNTRGGHLPGAVLLPHAALIDGSRLRSADELQALLAATGFRQGDHIVTHCDGGGRAALAAVAARRAGFDDVRAYYLSFADWAADESCEIVSK